MDFDKKIQILTQQLNIASRDVIVTDRMLGQTRERVAEIQGRINMLVELQQEEKKPKGESKCCRCGEKGEIGVEMCKHSDEKEGEMILCKPCHIVEHSKPSRK